jgi:hypothetical protein
MFGTGRSEIRSIIFASDIRLILGSGAGFPPIESVSVRLFNTSMVALIRMPPLFNVDSMKTDSFSLAVVHEEVTLSPDWSLSDLGESWLQIGNLSCPKAQGWTLCVTQAKWERCLDIRLPGAMEMKSVSISVPFDGNYSLSALSELESGYCMTSTNDPFSMSHRRCHSFPLLISCYLQRLCHGIHI